MPATGKIGVREVLGTVVYPILELLGEAAKFGKIKDFAEDNQFYHNLFPEYKSAVPEGSNEIKESKDVSMRPGIEQTYFQAMHPLTKESCHLKGIIRAKMECPHCKQDKLRWVLHMDKYYLRMCEPCNIFEWIPVGHADFSQIAGLADQLFKHRRLQILTPERSDWKKWTFKDE